MLSVAFAPMFEWWVLGTLAGIAAALLAWIIHSGSEQPEAEAAD